MSAGMAGHETGDSASDRPIYTLLHAGVGGCIEKPFGRYHWQDKDWCSPDDALRADDTETTQVEAVQATQGSSVISQSEATQVTLCKCQLTRPGLDSTYGRDHQSTSMNHG